MKKIALLLLFALSAFTAVAQMMPDSTVQVCAYWNVGDKYDYYVEHSSKKVNTKGDTVKNELNSKIMRFEVVDSTASSYQIRLTYLDEKSTNPENEQIYRISQTEGLNPSVLFTTTNHGVLVSIDNLEEIVAAYEELADHLVEITLDSLGPESQDLIDKAQLTQQMKAVLGNPQTIQTGILDEIGRMYFFHGARLEADRTYTMEEPLSFYLPGMEAITAKTNVWIEGDLTDEYSTVCRTYACADFGDEEFKSALRTATDVAMNSMNITDSLKTQVESEIGSIINNEATQYQLIWEQYSAEEVHLSTGWPLNLYVDKYIKVTAPDGEAEERIESRSFEIILTD